MENGGEMCAYVRLCFRYACRVFFFFCLPYVFLMFSLCFSASVWCIFREYFTVILEALSEICPPSSRSYRFLPKTNSLRGTQRLRERKWHKNSKGAGQVAWKGRNISSLSWPKPIYAPQGFRFPLARLGRKRLLRELERNLNNEPQFGWTGKVRLHGTDLFGLLLLRFSLQLGG